MAPLKMMRIDYLFFDLDGTLIDHFQAIYRSYVHVQETLGLPVSDFKTVLRSVGGSIPVTLGRLVGSERVEEALPIWRAHFAETMLEEVDALPGVEAGLTRLAEAGYRMAVFTNKDGPAARAVIEHLGWTRFFEKVAGAMDTPWRKPQIDFTLWMLRETGALAESTLMVGDSPFDVEAGKNVGMLMYGIATGSHTAGELEDAGADVVYPDFGAMVEAILRSRETATVQG